jgi:hypothetical protein
MCLGQTLPVGFKKSHFLSEKEIIGLLLKLSRAILFFGT